MPMMRFGRCTLGRCRRYSTAAAVRAALGVSLALGLAGRADDWPQWLGPRRNAVSAERGADRLLSPPVRVWTNAVGAGCASVVVSRGRAFTLGHVKGEGRRGTDAVYALDAATGRVLWRHTYDCLTCVSQDVLFDGPRSTPTVDGDRLYTLSLEGHLFCLLRNNAGSVACLRLLCLQPKSTGSGRVRGSWASLPPDSVSWIVP